MKKKLLFTFSLISSLSFAQDFTSANEYAIGDSQTMFMCDSAAPSYASSTGSNANWDYSAYFKMPNPDRIYQITANSNSSFPNATKVVSIQGILDTYLKSDASNRSSEGFQFTDQTLGTVTANFSSGNNMNVMDYPFAFNTTINDVFSGSLSGTGVVNPACSGTSVSTYDGTGTLKLTSTLTKTNVSRHHLYSEVNGTTILGPVVLKIDQYEYFDLASSSKLPLLSYTNLKIFLNGSQATSMNFLLNSADPVFFVGTEELASENVQVYPNPAENQIKVSSEEFDGTEVFEVTDLSGASILTTSNQVISTENLTPGVYFLNIMKGTERIVTKFVKK